MNTGPHGFYSSLEKWRYLHLKSLGFQGSHENKVLSISSTDRHPGFYKGILSTDLDAKGPIIGKFLDTIGFYPRKIIMFDDMLEELQSVENECRKRGIVFIGYVYKGAHQKAWDSNLIQLQADYLIQNKKWLNDETAKKFL